MKNPRYREVSIVAALTILFIGIGCLAAIPELFTAGTMLFRVVHWITVLATIGGLAWLYFSVRSKPVRSIHGSNRTGTQTTEENQQSEVLVTEEDWEHRIDQLQQREQALADRLATFHGWQEFPSPIDLSDPDRTDEQVADLANKDREMLKLLSEEAELLFERIQQNVYRPDGVLDMQRMRDDAFGLADRVARIYQPDSERPLAETSIEQILRASSRAFMQMLIVTEQLPMNVQSYSLNDLYLYVQRGIKAYQVYKSVTPYWPYVNTAYYLGRLALGANPITMAAGWAISSAGVRGAKFVASRVVNQQAIVMLHQVIQVIGYEAANMYGGDFRYRDANWIYAAELSHMLSGIETTPKILKAALKEIAALRLRNEYDRVYIYRVIAENSSAIPKRFRARSILTEEERTIVQTQLVRFAKKVAGLNEKAYNKWLRQLNKRLDVGDPQDQEDDEAEEDESEIAEE